MPRYLVTGGAGFIGSHIAEALLARNESVRILDDLSTGYQQNLAHLEGEIEFLQGDIRDNALVERAVEGVEVVFHQAALASVHRSLSEPQETHAVCATGTLILLEQARQAGVRRVVYAASSSAYGDQLKACQTEKDLAFPVSPYAASKLAGEHYCRSFYKAYGLETVCLRYFNVFGPRQDPDSPYSAVIPLFIGAMLNGKQPVVFGDGEQSRDFVFVKDIVHGNLLAAEAEGVAGRVINLATSKQVSLLELIAHLNEMLGLEVEPIHQPAREGDVRHSLADISLAKDVLGYEPTFSLAEGLQQSIDYYRTLVDR
jgi:UDP-glucose 4-epimerase